MKKVALFVLTFVFALSMCVAMTGCVDETKSFKVSFDSDGGSVVAEQIVDEGSLATEPDAPVKTGYTFAGWILDGAAYDFTAAVTADITLKAAWTANTDTAYTVEHYQQNLANDEYTLVAEDTENKTGATAAQTAATAKEYTGFTAKAIGQAAIAADGSTVVKVYYDRNTFTVTVDENGGEEVADITGVKYGATVTAPSTAKVGYTFAGWTLNDAAYDFTAAVTADITLKATWTANTDTAYTVEHYQQNLANDEYTLVEEDTENKTGTTAELTAAAAKTYTGFTAKAFEQVAIAGDGSTVIKIYYDRNTFTVTVDENGGEEVADITGVKYGATISAPAITKAGSTLLGWNYDFNTVVTSDITIKALWGYIELNETEKSFIKKGTVQLTAEVGRDDEGSTDLVWESSNNAVATVSAEGLVTAVGVGEAVITAKFEDGKVSATCAIYGVDPYKNTSTGVHEYDFATGNVKITGKGDNENNNGANYLIDNMAANFAVDFTISGASFDNDNDNFVFRLVSTHGRGTSMNLYWWNTRGSIKVPSDSWTEHRHDPGTSLSQMGNYINTNVGDVRKDTYKVHFERYIDTENATVTYAWIITNANGISTMKVYTDKLSTDNCNTAEQTKGVGFSVWSRGGALTDSYTISDFVYTPDYAVASKLALSAVALEFTKAGEIALSHAETTETLVWSSLNENIATIENGKVTAKAIGYTTIVAKNANGTVVAACNVWCRDPYSNVNQGSHTYDFTTGEVFITGSHDNENNSVAYFNLNNMGNKDKLADNFAVEFRMKSMSGDHHNVIKVMSSKCGRGTAMNYEWWGSEGWYWCAGNWGGTGGTDAINPGIADIYTGDYYKVRFERSVDRDAATITYKITIWSADESNSKTIEFSDKINDNSNPDYTYAVGFGVRHKAGDGKGIYVKDFTYTAL